MKRVVALAVLVSFVGVPVAQAQERRFTPRTSVSFLPPATPGVTELTRPKTITPAPRLTKASIEKAVAAAAHNANVPAMRRRNVFKNVWFWVVVGGAVAAIAVFAYGGSNGDGSNPY